MPRMGNDQPDPSPEIPHSPGALLNINEIASTLRVSKMTVYRFIRDGRLPAIRIGNSLRVYRSDLNEFLFTACLPSLGYDSGEGSGGALTTPSGI